MYPGLVSGTQPAIPLYASFTNASPSLPQVAPFTRGGWTWSTNFLGNISWRSVSTDGLIFLHSAKRASSISSRTSFSRAFISFEYSLSHIFLSLALSILTKPASVIVARVVPEPFMKSSVSVLNEVLPPPAKTNSGFEPYLFDISFNNLTLII